MKERNTDTVVTIVVVLVTVFMSYGCRPRNSDNQAITKRGTSMRSTQVGDVSPARSALEVSRLVELSQRRAFDFFWYETHPQTGLVKDRAGNTGPDAYTVSSIAATGFGLAALPIGVEHGWITRDQAYNRVLTTLRFFRNNMYQQRGWYYHFVDMHTGERVWNCEVSSIDTALLLAGALFAGEYFGDTEVARLADELYRRVAFHWMLTDGGAKPQERLLCHGWTPENSFLPYRWGSYSEHMILYVLAIGSPTYPITAESWSAWARPIGEYAGYKIFAVGPLFTHQFSHAFIDFRGKQDGLGYDYWQSSTNATLANRQFCLDNADKFRTYGENVWGLSACDGPNGYRAYGAPPGQANHDGTVAPWAVIASIVFTPELSMESMRYIHEAYGENVWGRYGFSDGFNIDRDFWAKDVIGIDLGAALLMIENYRSNLVWKHFMSISYVQDAMQKVGFVSAKSEGSN